MSITENTPVSPVLHAFAQGANPDLAGYCRSATDNPDHMEKQKQMIVEHCASEYGAVPTMFVDTISGNLTSRPGMSDLVEHCKCNPGCKVMVADASRLGRTHGALRRVEQSLHEAGATWESASLARHFRDLDERLMRDRAVFAAAAARLRRQGSAS